jgi:mono/diheme cytochrome c family protein
LKACTATCGAAVYRGGVKEFGSDVFIPEPAGNLVKRFTLTEKDAALTGANSLGKGEEFMASTDERFRPVNAYTGPDGALYLADMYRGVIQHKGFLTHYLIANIKDRNLEQPFNMGRIWRIVPEGAKLQAPKLPAGGAELAAFLKHPNGWVRDTAQRVLVEKKDMAAVLAITDIVKTGPALGKIHALWTLEGIGALTPDVVTVALKDADAKVRATAARLADRTLAGELANLANDSSVDVQIALAFTASSFPETQETALALARRAGAQPMVRDALLSGLRGRELEVLETLLAGKNAEAAPDVLSVLAAAVMNERRAARVEKLIHVIAAQPSGSPAQLALLEGASGKNAPKGAPKAKLLYLTGEVPELAKLLGSADAKAKPLLVSLDARIAWPNKPGVPPPPVVKPLSPAEQQLFEKGKLVYSTLCTACHQPNGQGMEGLAPALVDSDWVLGDVNIIPRIVLHGLSGPIKVNGQTWSLEMPPLGAALTDEQIAGVITYIRREWEHTASPITVEQVKKIREEHKDRTKGWSAEELGIGTKKQARK